MKKITILSLFVLIFVCCSKQKRAENSNEIVVSPRPEMKAILDSFIVSCNDKSLRYELYIDKIHNWDYDNLLYSGKKSLVNNSRPIMKTVISDVTIYIYSGIEHYFESTFSQLNNPQINESLPDEIPEGNYWLITEKDGKLNIIKDGAGFPFYRSNRVEFVPPVENNSDEEPEWIIESVGRKE